VRLAAATSAPSVAAGWNYDEFILTRDGMRTALPQSLIADAATVSHVLATSAAAEAPLRRAGIARYRGPVEMRPVVTSGAPS
jgi:hypothetical protein